MKRIWEAIGVMLVTALAIKLLFDLIAPYVLWLVIGVFIWLIGGWTYARHRRW